MKKGDLVKITYGNLQHLDKKGVIAYDSLLEDHIYQDQYRGVLLLSGELVWTLVYNLEVINENR
tara:strand:+ start:952 stop:1143 length:192 start_codon:yes stop_codon:yes gene_type:complete